jgi:hypothetical protein
MKDIILTISSLAMIAGAIWFAIFLRIQTNKQKALKNLGEKGVSKKSISQIIADSDSRISIHIFVPTDQSGYAQNLQVDFLSLTPENGVQVTEFSDPTLN